MSDRARRHTCHAEACEVYVPPKIFMCRTHWFMLSKALRDAVWEEYVPGQELRMDPTPEYLNVTQRCINLIAVKEGRRMVGT